MAIAFISTVAGAPLAVFGTEMWAAGGGLRAWLMLEAVCDKPRWFLSASVLYYFYLFCISATFLPYCLLNGRRVHQATREALLRLRHQHAASGGGGGFPAGYVSLYLRDGAYYVLIATWSLLHLGVSAELWSRFISTYVVATLLVAGCVRKRHAMGQPSAPTEWCRSLAPLLVGVAANAMCNLTMYLFAKAFSAMGVECMWLKVAVSVVLVGCYGISTYKAQHVMISAPSYRPFAYLLPGAYDGYFESQSAEQRATDVPV
ncbi:unnamed protein product [Vitrella brassicaformis CCMP3155]|uniref:Uncharacterized protein n=1 Tax=Vitrella brassicaformis (strain CCMP3155) TaxID=1169540 RepID=A0A0G4EQP9_VITBC|nr:unnamed protein product [Vitrella brassicaformis CCMP3155]|eukprot:CEL99787.1 unnamed protein product [Vitrella brassicaformis CCMP3155]